MLIYLLLIFSLYFIFLILLLAGWQEAIRHKGSGAEGVFISVVVAVRNEAQTLSSLIATLATQTYDRTKYEVILVDDHSTDGTAALTIKLKHQYPDLNLIIIPASGVGKKQALTDGINAAKGEIILTTDADCESHTWWLGGMVDSFNTSTNMVVGAVKIESNSFFSKLQSLEFASIMGSGIALLGWRIPILCNGANLAFRKQAFTDVHGYEGNFQIPSGDDEFLMRKIERAFPGTIQFADQEYCVVTTQPVSSVSEFFQQRLRWAGKWKANDSLFAKSLAVFILLVQISWLLLLIMVITNPGLNAWSVLAVIKLVLESLFFWPVCRHLNQKFYAPAFFALQILYPLYVVTTGVLSQIMTYRWKGRESPSGY